MENLFICFMRILEVFLNSSTRHASTGRKYPRPQMCTQVFLWYISKSNVNTKFRPSPFFSYAKTKKTHREKHHGVTTDESLGAALVVPPLTP